MRTHVITAGRPGQKHNVFYLFIFLNYYLKSIIYFLSPPPVHDYGRITRVLEEI